MDYLTIALVLFAAGAVMLIGEVVLPTGGFLVVASLLFFGVGVAVIMVRGTSTEAVVAMAGLAIGLPVAGMIAISAWRRLSLKSILSEEESAATAAPSDLDMLKNRTGKTVSPMRPSGSVEFEGRRIDAMTEGMMLDVGVWVRCVDVKGGRVIVRQIDSPLGSADLDDEPLEPPPPIVHEAPTEPESKRPKPVDDFDLDL